MCRYTSLCVKLIASRCRRIGRGTKDLFPWRPNFLANQEGPVQSEEIFSCCKSVSRVINTLVCEER